MTINIGGPGITLPFPQTLYPANLSATTNNYEAATNYVTLNTGQTQLIPPGWWWVTSDGYSVIQYYDPVNTIWRGWSSARKTPERVWSDGQNFRIANLTGCPVAAVVTAQGSGYAQSTTTVTANGTGGSTWLPIIGGAISTSVTVGTAGSGYTIPPIVYFPAPPAPGVQATGYATLSTGTVSGITVTNQGAGYTVAPVPVILPSPFDPNIANIVPAAATTTISGNAGKLCAVLCTNPGTSVAVPTLTVTGAGSSATATAVSMCTITATSGSGGSNFTSGQNLAITVGGQSNASTVLTNPEIEPTAYVPRQGWGVPTVSGGAITGFTMTDNGLYMSSNLSSNQPTLLVLAQTGSTDPSGALTISVTLGGTQSLVVLQPA